MLATLRFYALLFASLGTAAALAAEPMPPDIARRLDAIFAASQAPGMAAAVVVGDHTYFAGLGAARVGEAAPPNARSLLRLNSLTKVMTGEILGNLIDEGRIDLDDPLQRYAPPGRAVPRTKNARAITLRDLAVHTAGLPRDMPPGLDRGARWAWLEQVHPSRAPGRVAEYSNAAWMFLGDALTRATNTGFDALLESQITGPLALADTTLAPNAEQCRRLMAGRDDHACEPTNAIDAMGGLYSTTNDMIRWMRAHMSEQRVIVRRTQLKRLIGLDMAGRTQAIGLGWMHMRLGDLAVVQKTGGGGGFMNYVVIAPSRNIGVFVTVTRSDIEMLRRLTADTNALMRALANR